MTYNWNNMVSITVPTGTNGWLYSGEVIINGVKVRFPVGVPTSVPEPAAVLLKKMIELEQEEDANTAKPQNHYVGDVTIPAGKTLTLEKGAKFVDNSSPSEVVIMPETEIAFDNTTTCPITTPFANKPTFGGTYKIIWDGVEYTTSNIVDATNTIGEGVIACYVLGNTDILGFTEMLGTNPDASANIFLALIPDGQQQDDVTMYGLLAVASEPVTTTAVLSIVQVGAASGGGSESAGGGRFVFNATVGDPNEESQGLFYVTYDKTYSEIVSAWENGAAVYCVFDIGLVFDGPESAGNYCYLPLLTHDTNSKSLECSAYAMDITLVAHVAEDSSANFFQMKFPNA